MAHHHPLTGTMVSVANLVSPRLGRLLLDRKIRTDLRLMSSKQLLLGADGRVRAGDDILRNIVARLKKPGQVRPVIKKNLNIEMDNSISVNVELLRYLGRLCPLSVFTPTPSPFNNPIQMSVHFAITTELTFKKIARNDLHSSAHFVGMIGLTTENNLDKMALDTAKAIENMIAPSSSTQRRSRTMFDHWLRAMEHYINGTAGLDAIAAIALKTNGDVAELELALGAHHIEVYAEGEQRRKQINTTDGDGAVSVEIPSTGPIYIDKSNPDSCAGSLAYHPQIETQGVLSMFRPVMMATVNYVLIETTIPESLIHSYNGKPLRDLVDHPLLNRIDFIIEAIETHSNTPLTPTRAERRVLTQMGERMIWYDNQPRLNDWFEMPVVLANPTESMVKIHLRAPPGETITQEEARSFQLP